MRRSGANEGVTGVCCIYLDVIAGMSKTCALLHGPLNENENLSGCLCVDEVAAVLFSAFLSDGRRRARAVKSASDFFFFNGKRGARLTGKDA